MLKKNAAVLRTTMPMTATTKPASFPSAAPTSDATTACHDDRPVTPRSSWTADADERKDLPADVTQTEAQALA